MSSFLGEWRRTVDPVDTPVSLEDVRGHGRIVPTDQDDAILRFIDAGTDEAENALGFGIMTQTWRLDLPRFADVIWLPMARVLQNSASPTDTRPVIQYYDTDGTQQTLATSYYTVDTQSTPGRICRAPNQSWPSVQSDRVSPITITYVVGWTDPDDVPARIRQGLRSYVSYLEYDRDGSGDRAEAARAAALACWTDRLYVRPLEC